MNNPHRALEAAGVAAAQKGLRVCSCHHRHPAMKASWLERFAQEQQLILNL
ncbi:CrpP family ICE-associated protein [Pseudomonas viridiflava]|uniref:CrpP family ICE-associated protein n=1 Tax=Pseudomonas viridiflava TaxID=33069 RepID=UPI000F02B537|nr:CrpP family ICE-associated protein [Pseudomonas viridiflava]